MDDSIKITVAGVPKKTGSSCLKSLDDFKPGFIFKGEITNKKTHTFLYNDKKQQNNEKEKVQSSAASHPALISSISCRN